VTQSPESILFAIPGWNGASVTELSGGLNNQTWLAEMDGRKAVLKIDEQPRSEPFNSRPAEASVQSIAARQGLAGAVLHVDEQVLLCEFLEGQVWKPQHLERDDNIELVATTLRRLHTLPLTGRSFDSTVAARRYVANIDNRDTALVAHCTRVIESMRLPHKLCCCHNDLVAENIVTAPGMMFLDWEYACDNDPLFDLATVVEHHDLGEEAAFRLLDAYFDGDRARWREQLNVQMRLYEALCWLWSAANASPAQEE